MRRLYQSLPFSFHLIPCTCNSLRLNLLPLNDFFGPWDVNENKNDWKEEEGKIGFLSFQCESSIPVSVDVERGIVDEVSTKEDFTNMMYKDQR